MLLGNYDRSGYDLSFPLAGIPVRVVPWFWLMTVIMGWNNVHRGVDFLLVWVVVVFISILLHELGHALMSRWFGYRVHITLYQMGGVAEYEPNYGHTLLRSILISLAGPMAGFVLFGLVWALEPVLFVPLMRNLNPRSSLLLREFLGDMWWVNLIWGLVNLLPVLPLDGGHICRDVCLMLNRQQGFIWALRISVVAAFGFAWYAYQNLGQYTAVFFVLLGVESLTSLQQIPQGINRR